MSQCGESREHYPKGQRLRKGLVVEGLGGFFISCVPAEVQKVRCLPSQRDKCYRDCSGGMDIITVTDIILVTCAAWGCIPWSPSVHAQMSKALGRAEAASLM